MKSTAKYINEKKRDSDDVAKVDEVLDKIGRPKEVRPNPNRRLLQEGFVTEIIKNAKLERYIHLFNDVYIVSLEHTKGTKKHLSFVEQFSLLDASTFDAGITSEGLASFQLNHPGHNHTFVAATEDEKIKWTTAFQNAISKSKDIEQKRKDHHIEIEVVEEKGWKDYIFSKVKSNEKSDNIKRTSSRASVRMDEKPASPSLLNSFKESKQNVHREALDESKYNQLREAQFLEKDEKSMINVKELVIQPQRAEIVTIVEDKGDEEEKKRKREEEKKRKKNLNLKKLPKKNWHR